MTGRPLKPLVAVILTAAGTAIVVGFRTVDLGVATTDVTTGDTSGLGASAPIASAPTTTRTRTVPAPTPTADARQVYADGTWTGQAIEEPWGMFQVEAIVSDGQLTQVGLLEAPDDRHSNRINRQAVPILTEEAIAAQDASIDMLSGATWTSDSYITSLQAALDDARAAQAAAA